MKEYKLEEGKLYAREVERTSAGNCYYCGEPVYASEGQAITYRKYKDRNTDEVISEPCHKKCRKQNK